MARKKRTENTDGVAQTQTAEADTATGGAEPQAPVAATERPAWVDGPTISSTATDVPDTAREEPPKHWGDPYKRIFSSNAKGFEMGENRRFKQRVFKFHERPDPAIIDALKENGFTYRAAEKSWTIPATAETRRLSEELAHQFAGEAQGMSR